MATPANAAAASEMTVSYRLATEADREALREALLRYFYPEEGVNTCYNGNPEVAPDDVDFYVQLVAEGCTTLAIEDGTGQIVGFCAGGMLNGNEAQNMAKLAQTTETEKFADILRFLAFMAKQANIPERYGVTNIYYMYGVGVDHRYRQRSVASALMEQQFELARKLGAAVAYGDTTGVKSAGMCKKLGMEIVYSIAYNDYRDEKGRQVFLSSDPDLMVQTVVKRL